MKLSLPPVSCTSFVIIYSMEIYEAYMDEDGHIIGQPTRVVYRPTVEAQYYLKNMISVILLAFSLCNPCVLKILKWQSNRFSTCKIFVPGQHV